MHDRIIYKLMPRAEWDAAQEAGVYSGSADDRRDGFIHFSTEAQIADTARKHFHAVEDLLLLAVDAALLGPHLKWEPSRGGALFPHLYAPLPLGAVLSVTPISRGATGQHDVPGALAQALEASQQP